MDDAEDIAAVAAVVAYIAKTFPDRQGEVLAGLVVNAIGHFLGQPGSDSFCAALNARLADIAHEHGRRPFVLMELGTQVPARH